MLVFLLQCFQMKFPCSQKPHQTSVFVIDRVRTCGEWCHRAFWGVCRQSNNMFTWHTCLMWFKSYEFALSSLMLMYMYISLPFFSLTTHFSFVLKSNSLLRNSFTKEQLLILFVLFRGHSTDFGRFLLSKPSFLLKSFLIYKIYKLVCWYCFSIFLVSWFYRC